MDKNNKPKKAWYKRAESAFTTEIKLKKES